MSNKINGIFLLDKPLHLTSNHALQRVKRLFGAKKAGHTGSLDPLATGMLPICFGEATKFSQFLLESDKRYQVKARLGIKTTTGDTEGEIISEKPIIEVTLEKVKKTLETFLGETQQIPPMFSAIKHQGKPLYEFARKGIDIERASRKITVHHLHLLHYHHDELEIDIHCSKGTYVRTIVEDIGEELNCGAHVTTLRRLHVFPYENSKMMTLDTLEKIIKESLPLQDYLLPIETAVASFPEVILSTSAVFYIRQGQSVKVSNLNGENGFVRMYTQDRNFLGVGEIVEDGRIAPRRLVT
jgi:tRNA pseudouridine55 synthase